MVDLSVRAFNKRVTIKNVTKTPDLSKGHSEAYTDFVETWAVVDSKGGSRAFSDGSMYVFDRKDFYLRWRSSLGTITEDSLFVYEGKEYKYQASSFVNERKDIIKYETVGS